MLTPSAVTNAKPKAAPYKLADERGLYLYVKPNGARLWRFDYRRPGTGKRNTLSLGVFPDVSLRVARERRDEARTKLADGIDPGTERAAERAARSITFEAVASEWIERQRASLSPFTYTKAQWMLAQVPSLHARPVAELNAPEVLRALRKIEARGTIETAHRVKQRIGRVMR